jgi:hypothetical protein
MERLLVVEAELLRAYVILVEVQTTYCDSFH